MKEKKKKIRRRKKRIRKEKSKTREIKMLLGSFLSSFKS
jgi:hypothetical protein